MEKYCRAGRDTGNIIIRCILIECWIPKTTNTLRICNTNYFSTATVLARTVGAELFHADRRTDRHDKANKSLFAIMGTRLEILRSDHTVYVFCMDLGTNKLFSMLHKLLLLFLQSALQPLWVMA